MKKIEIVLDGEKAEAMESAIAEFVSKLFNESGWEGNTMSVKSLPKPERDIVVPDFLKRKAVSA